MERALRDFLDGVKIKLGNLKKHHFTEDDLGRITAAITEKAENQRRDYGPAFGVANDLRETSKAFIEALECGDPESVLEGFREVFGDLWWALGRLDLVPHFASQQDAEAGSEVGEAEAVYDFRRLIFNRDVRGKRALIAETRRILEQLWYRLGDPKADPQLAELADREDQVAEEARSAGQPPPKRVHRLTLPYPAWLAGILDALGEISKFVTRANAFAELEEEGPAPEFEEDELVIRFIHIGRTAYSFVANFETCYGPVINNSQLSGWHNTFRGMLGRLAGLIKFRNEELEQSVAAKKRQRGFLADMKAMLETHTHVGNS